MPIKRWLQLALLLPQFALLMLAVYSDLRDLRYELEFHSPRTWGCTAFPFNPAAFGCELLGLAAVIGLCARRGWARFLYVILAVGLLTQVLPAILRSPDGYDLPSLFWLALILGTVGTCLVPWISLFLRFVQRRHQPG